uniref:MARVEL domain-containing protein n=1 Tax=Globodera pallida TaxID=36090 RepID=A0A183C9B3_GLOPA
MAFEHDQFARFMAAPASARNGHHLSVVHPQQKPPVLARPPRRVVAKMDGTTAKRRRAALIVVTLKLALLCGWLLHELIVGFDESQCLQIAVAGASPASPFVVTSSPHNMAQAPLLSSTAAANRTETDAKLEQYRRFDPTDGMLGVRVPLNAGQSSMPPPTASSPFAAGGAAAVAAVEEQRQFHGTDSKNSAAAAPHPKRRRKVILRRKLLRKGASTVNWQQQKKKEAGARIVNGGGAATVRRVVWRVVPLKRLPPTTTKSAGAGGIGLPAGDDDEVQRRLDAFPFENEFAAVAGDQTGGWPLRTKTGTVVVRPDGGRRMARRRTAPEEENAVVVANAAAASTDEAEAAAEAFDWTQKNAQNGGPPPHSFRVPLLQQSASTISYQLITLMNVGFCFVRAVFDCWALLQCFCCALFLLGLYLRNGRLALVPTAVDAFSIVLAVLFGLSLVIFMLILLLLAHAVLPPSSLFRCVLFTVSVNVGVTLFAFCVFTELNAVAEMTKKRRRRRAKAADDESMATAAAVADGAATEWRRSGDSDSDAGGDGER